MRLLGDEFRKINYNIKTVCIQETNSNSNENFQEIEINYVKDFEILSLRKDISKCLYHKDLCSLSDKAYNNFRNGLNIDIAPLKQVKKYRKNLDSKFDIKKLSTGYYVDPIFLIEKQVEHIILNNFIKENEKILIKLSADGTNICRNVKLINVVFNIINEDIKASTATGCYRIGIFEYKKEDYETINTFLPFIWNEIKYMEKIYYKRDEKKVVNFFEVNRKIADDMFKDDEFNKSELTMQDYFIQKLETMNIDVHEVEYFFSADWNMMSYVLGVYGANSNHPCLYCEQTKTNLSMIGKRNSLIVLRQILLGDKMIILRKKTNIS